MIVLTANGEIKEHITGLTATPPLDLTGDVLSLTTPLAAQYGGTGISQSSTLTLGAPINIDQTGAVATNVLAYDGSKWVPASAGAGTITGGGTAPKIPKWTAASALGDSILSETTSGVTITLTQGVATTGSPRALVVVGGAHTTLTASVEAVDVNFDLSRIVQWDTGAINIQRAVIFDAPSYAFVGASTITTAINVSVEGPPGANTNASINTSYGLYVRTAGIGAGVTSGIAFRSDAPSGATTNWAAYLSGRVTVTSSVGVTPLFEVAQFASTTGSPTAVLVTGAAHTTLAASTEAIDVNVNLARTVQFAQGALTTQRAVVFQAPTYAFATGASTLTIAATVAITGAPAAGANAILTNAYALWVQAGKTLFGAATVTAGILHGVEVNIGATSAASVDATGLSVTATITAGANNQVLRGMLFFPLYAKGTATGTIAQGLLITAQTPTGSGTIVSYAGLQVLEQTIATANISLLVGAHPGGSTNYSMYINSSNALFLGSGAWRIDSQNSTGTNAATFTATNKPGSAVTLTPQTWLKINLGGTDYYVPCWI